MSEVLSRAALAANPDKCEIKSAPGQICGCAQLSEAEANYDNLSLVFTIKGYQNICPVICPLTIVCDDKDDCYCLYSSGVAPTSAKIDGISKIPVPTFPIKICPESLNKGTNDINFLFTYKLPKTCPIEFNNTFSLTKTNSDGNCPTTIPSTCDIVSRSCVNYSATCETPVLSCEVTKTCELNICPCKTSSISRPCESLSCEEKFELLDELFPATNPLTNDVTFNITSPFGPGLSINGVIPYVNIDVTTNSPLLGSYAGWCLAYADKINVGPSYNAYPVNLSAPGAGTAILNYYNNSCDNTNRPAIYVDNLIGILQIFNNAATYEAVNGYIWSDIQVAIWTILFNANPQSSYNIISDGLSYTQSNVEAIINDALDAQERYDTGNDICVALVPNNNVGGIILINKTPCVQIMALQFPICSLPIAPPSIDYDIIFDNTLTCKTCLKVNLSGYCKGAKNFTFSVIEKNGTDFILIYGPQPFNGVSATVCTPELVISPGVTQLATTVTFTSSNGTQIAVDSDLCDIPQGSEVDYLTSKVCLSDCLNFSILGSTNGDCLSTIIPIVTINENEYSGDCGSESNISLLKSLLSTFFPSGKSLKYLNDNCIAPFTLSNDQLSLLLDCNLHYTVSFPTIPTTCCGTCLLVKNTLQLNIGFDNCTSPISNCTTESKASSNAIVTYDTIKLPNCGVPKPKENRNIRKNKEIISLKGNKL